MKNALFIGRWQPLHSGHRWLFDQKLSKGIPILVAIRDVPPDAGNPFTPQQAEAMIKAVYKDNPLVQTMIIPDIESVNYGRGVGYEINEFVPPKDIHCISATNIRACIASGDASWKFLVDPSIHEMLFEVLSRK